MKKQHSKKIFLNKIKITLLNDIQNIQVRGGNSSAQCGLGSMTGILTSKKDQCRDSENTCPSV